MLLDDDKAGPIGALLRSLFMRTITNGKLRSGKEFKELLEKHGFVDIEVKRLDPVASTDVILCRKGWNKFKENFNWLYWKQYKKILWPFGLNKCDFKSKNKQTCKFFFMLQLLYMVVTKSILTGKGTFFSLNVLQATHLTNIVKCKEIIMKNKYYFSVLVK